VKIEELEELHYITPIENMKSIFSLGILSHEQAEKLRHKSVAKKEVQEKRKRVVIPGGHPLHQYVNLYFHARNPMMFQIKSRHTDIHKEICVIRINKNILNSPGVVIADKNASSEYARFAPSPDGLRIIDKELVFAKYWHHEDPIEKDRHTSIKCAEVLVPDKIPKEFILGVYVSCNESKAKLYDIISEVEPDFSITVNPEMFFQ
jgi:hypothetical protein